MNLGVHEPVRRRAAWIVVSSIDAAARR